jgi:hypothetical protein
MNRGRASRKKTAGIAQWIEEGRQTGKKGPRDTERDGYNGREGWREGDRDVDEQNTDAGGPV